MGDVMQHQGLDISKIEQEVKTRWLSTKEVLEILQNHESFTLINKPPHKPPSGSWFLYNRRVLRYFRNDGYAWQKKRNGKTNNESHEVLKVDKVKVLNCYYARNDQNPAFYRRVYWMLDPAYEHIAFVHYRDVLKGSISAPTRNDSSASDQNGSASRAEVHSSAGWTSELTAPGPNSFSPGSAEVSSQNLTINNETCSRYDFAGEKEALRRLEMQLSLDGTEDININTQGVKLNSEPVLVHGFQNGDPGSCTNLEDIFNLHEFSEDQFAGTETLPFLSTIDVQKSSDTWFKEELEANLPPDSTTENENQWFFIHEVSPEWAFCSESTKVIIAGKFLYNPSDNSQWAMMFGDVQVPVEIVQQGVIRCHTPFLAAGKVRMHMIDGNGKPCSEMREFEFYDKAIKSNGNPFNETWDFEFQNTKNSDELLRQLLNFVHMLFDGNGCEVISKFNLQLAIPNNEFQGNQMDIKKKTSEQLDNEGIVNRIMEALLSDKFEQWLSSKITQNSDGDHLLPKQYHKVIHTIAALGYEWALKPLIISGVPINYRDKNGWAALHWAARFGREGMVAALLTAGAAAGALSHPTSEDPAATTPASIASAYGFEGLSAFLSGAQLITHLNSLEQKEKANHKGHVVRSEVSSDLDRVWDTSTRVHDETDDQLALKDSLGAIRNAVQAAGRIHEAFQVSSFTEKQERGRNICILSTHETVTASHAIVENAALSIQKNFRCWKKRKEYLKMRKHVVKMQARVRAHQGRNKYRELLWSVGVLEKVMLRWYRGGVGMRGFNSGAMLIDEEVEEGVVKVFRKQRVETAINEAVFRVSSIIDNPIARQQYRRMLEIYQQAKVNI